MPGGLDSFNKSGMGLPHSRRWRVFWTALLLQSLGVRQPHAAVLRRYSVGNSFEMRPIPPLGKKAAHSVSNGCESYSSMPEPLDSRQLRAFASLARTGSFTQTARELRLSQSAISHSMKALEQEVRCRLLDRMGKTVVLTQAGEQLLAHAERILAEMAAARERLGELGKWGHGRLRLCTSTTA